MKKKLLALLFGGALVFSLTACGGDDTADNGGGTTTENDGGETAAVNAEELVQSKGCIACHGQNLEGMGDAFPALTDVGARLSKDEIKDVIVNGKGNMQPQPVNDEEAEAIAEWLAAKK